MADKVIYAMYDDDDVLKDGAKMLVGKGVHVADVYSPFPSPESITSKLFPVISDILMLYSTGLSKV